MNESLALFIVMQTIVGVQQGATLDSLLFRILVGFVMAVGSLVSAIAVRFAQVVIPQIKRVNDFFVTWYGDPNDKSPSGIKDKIETMSTEVSELKGWSGSYDRALGALAEDNDRLRKVWSPGDPDRRGVQKTPRL